MKYATAGYSDHSQEEGVLSIEFTYEYSWYKISNDTFSKVCICTKRPYAINSYTYVAVTPIVYYCSLPCNIIECIFYSHCPYAVAASRSMAIVVDPQLKLIMFLFLSCNVLCSQCSLSP